MDALTSKKTGKTWRIFRGFCLGYLPCSSGVLFFYSHTMIEYFICVYGLVAWVVAIDDYRQERKNDNEDAQ